MKSEKLIVKKDSTILRDLRESNFIHENDRLCMDGLDYEGAFVHDGISIYNPYTDTTGRFDVDPIEYYGDSYIKWYNSLGGSKYESEIESTEISFYFTENWVDDNHYDYVLDDYSMYIRNDQLYVWIDRGDYIIDVGDLSHLKMASLRYFKMLMYAHNVTGIDFTDILIYPTENMIRLQSEDYGWCDKMDFDEFIDENTHDGNGVEK